MTLIISAKGQHVTKDGKREGDFVVLGCDSRGVIEIGKIIRTEINKCQKLFQLNDYCCILLSGDSEFGFTLISEFLEKSELKSKGVSDIAAKFCKFCRNRFNEIENFSLASQELFPDIDFIVSGMDKEGGKFGKGKIFILRKDRLFTPSLSADFTPSGQTLLAYYLFEKGYKKDLNLDDTCSLVAQAIYETERINGNVGGEITLAVIDSNKFRFLNAQEYYKEWEQQELDKIIHGSP